jgi:iron complex outermembrane receptor protein
MVRHAFRATVSAAAFLTLTLALPAHAEAPAIAAAEPAPETTVADDAGSSIIVTAAKSTRSATAIPASEIQKILPGISPLKAIQTLPGVLYLTSDPWGYNEQNAQIFIHGFNANQLGYTMDGIPLGDQSYGNYNGLAPQRAVISENVGRVVVATGAGDLATASNSNLGGTVETFSSDPLKKFGIQANQTFGSYGTSRTFVRIDSGDIGGGNSAYASAARQRARAWDFQGIQGGYQVNGKFVHEGEKAKLTLFFDYNDMTQPNEDATTFFQPFAGNTATAAQNFTPYTRPYYYPDFTGYRTTYLSALGNTPAGEGGNYRNYYSDAQRTDYLGYARLDTRLGSRITWSTTAYYHHNDGAGVVAGPLGQSITAAQPYLDPTFASLPANCRFGANGNGVLPTGCTAMTATQAAARGAALVAATGGSGLIARTTEYRIDRGGVITALTADFGAHHIEVGGWFEHDSTTQWRRWYGIDVNNPASSTPYIRPLDVEPPLFTQYQGEARINELQLHIQDSWQALDKLFVQAGFKTSAQWANGYYPIQPLAPSLGAATTTLPNGRINTTKWFLPAVGATYDFNGHEQLYFNVQKNLRHYVAYLAGGGGPWFTGSQAAFDAFATQGKPESSWTYEGGLRTKRSFDSRWISGIEAQINYYHVVFNNRLLAISTNPGGIAGSGITGGTSVLVNVGSVHTDGVDAAVTLHLNRFMSIYNATSYNSSTYQSDYTSTAAGIGAATGSCIGGVLTVGGVVPSCGKQVPGEPKWMNKTVMTYNFGPVEFQLIDDFIGKRYATYTNDVRLKSLFLSSLRVALNLEQWVPVKKAQVALNVTNLMNAKGYTTLSGANAANTYTLYPQPPRQFFVTLSMAY